jgi:hypothetical protein
LRRAQRIGSVRRAPPGPPCPCSATRLSPARIRRPRRAFRRAGRPAGRHRAKTSRSPARAAGATPPRIRK